MCAEKTTTELHIGFDDTDSAYGGCTTSLATEIAKELSNFNINFLDFPNLVRLNPNIPYKTRGNGSIAIRLQIEKKNLELAKRRIIELINHFSRVDDDNVNPGLVFVEDVIPTELYQFVNHALKEVVSKAHIKGLLERYEIEHYEWNAGRGLVGALGAVAYPFSEKDYTFELLAYREYEAKGERKIDIDSIYEAEKNCKGNTFSNLDKKYGRIMIIPNGPDPVFAGIRGETPQDVLSFWSCLKPKESIRDVMIFRTNQGTNAHIPETITPIEKLKPYMSAKIEGKVINNPHTLIGGHTRFKLNDNSRSIWCYAYEPTKTLRKDILKLDIDDVLEIFGGIRPPDQEFPICMNIENVIIKKMKPRVEYKNPKCPFCSKSLTSKGRNKGFYCKKCGDVWRDFEKIKIIKSPPFDSGTLLLPPVCAHRHLTKPRKRYGKEKNDFKTYDYNDYILKLLGNYS